MGWKISKMGGGKDERRRTRMERGRMNDLWRGR